MKILTCSLFLSFRWHLVILFDMRYMPIRSIVVELSWFKKTNKHLFYIAIRYRSLNDIAFSVVSSVCPCVCLSARLFHQLTLPWGILLPDEAIFLFEYNFLKIVFYTGQIIFLHVSDQHKQKTYLIEVIEVLTI